MDYIYGELNIATENKKYSGEETDLFDTKVCIATDKLRTISTYFLINNLIKKLTVTELKCSNQSICSNYLIVGSRVIRVVEV
ncbi:MAG: hypothetical protein J6S67_19975 [Methanobrevibacter sp.]|nr:hypothetical protein [Methanobrevibacter sp.]